MKKGFVIVCLSLLFGANSFAKMDSLPQVKYGSIVRLQLPSKFVDERFIDVWLPPNYNLQTKYKVLYMHDGQMLFDSLKTWNKKAWEVDETMHQLLQEKKIPNTIVVGIWNNGLKRHAEYFPEKAFYNLHDSLQKRLLPLMNNGKLLANNYLQFLVKEVKPFIDKTFSTKPQQQHTFIAGSSMGSLISLYAMCEYPTVFYGAACLSTHWIGTFNANIEIPTALQKYVKEKLPNASNHKLYFNHGTAGLDTKYTPHQLVANQIVLDKGYNAKNFKTEVVQNGEHTETDWAKQLPAILVWLMGK